MPAKIDLWIVNPSATFSSELNDACASLLTKDELSAVEKAKSETRRRELLVSRALMRRTLARFARVPPQECRFGKTEKGRPYLIGARDDLDFNLSHSAGYIVCGVALGAKIGVDIEAYDRGEEVAGVVSKVLHENEIAALAALDEPARNRRLIRLWTLKEAWAKGRGEGLGADFSSVQIQFDKNGEVHAFSDSQWRFSTPDISPAHSLSVAYQSSEEGVSMNSVDATEILTGG